MTLLFAGGGTGGHLYPAIALAEEIRRQRPDARLAFVGTSGKIEARVVPQKGYEFFTIWISGFARTLSARTLLFPLKVAVSLVQSFFLLKRLKPHAVVGTGGYVCGPVLFMASLLGIPTVVHESNSYPGVTTRLLASRVTRVFITFDITRRWLPAGAPVELTGNPTRDELSDADRAEAFRYFALDPGKKTVFAFGGSLGASSINRAMAQVVPDAVQNGYQVLWQTGDTEARSGLMVQHHAGVTVRQYIDRMDYGYAVADVVVSRSGATTLAELTRLGKPAILVPYPHAAANHQELNAQAMVDAGAAVMIGDAELSERLLKELHAILFNDGTRAAMERNSRALGRPAASKELAAKILELAKQ